MQKNGGSFWVRMIKGMVIGVAAMLPGASGGVLAVSMGVYKPVIDAVTSLFKSFIKSVKYLLPLGIGGLMGLFGTGRAVEALLASFKISVMWALIGMVLGGRSSADYVRSGTAAQAYRRGTAALQMVYGSPRRRADRAWHGDTGDKHIFYNDVSWHIRAVFERLKHVQYS